MKIAQAPVIPEAPVVLLKAGMILTIYRLCKEFEV